MDTAVTNRMGRNRPHRSRVVMTALPLGLLLTCAGLQATPPVPPLPDPLDPVDYLAWLEREFKPPSSEDAARLYAEVERLFPDYGDNDEQLASYITRPWKERNLELESRFIKYAWAMKEYEKATELTRCYVPLVKFGDFADFIVGLDFGAVRWPAKVLIAQAWRGFDNGNGDSLIEAARRCLVSADHLAQQPLISAEFSGGSLSDLGCITLVRALEHSGDPEAMVRRWGETVLGWTAPSISAARGFVGEQVGAFDSCQRCYHWNPNTGEIVLHPARAESEMILLGSKHPKAYKAARGTLRLADFEATRDALGQYFALIQDILARPYHESLRRVRAHEAFVTRKHRQPFLPLHFFKTSLLIRARHREATALARWHGMRLVWESFRDRQRTGTPIATLGDFPESMASSVGFATQQGLRWEYRADGATISLAITGFQQGEHAPADSTPDRITIWPPD